MPFTFLLCLGTVAVGILFCVDVDKSRRECRKYLEEEAVRVYGIGSSEVLVSGDDMDGPVAVVYGAKPEN